MTKGTITAKDANAAYIKLISGELDGKQHQPGSEENEKEIMDALNAELKRRIQEYVKEARPKPTSFKKPSGEKRY